MYLAKHYMRVSGVCVCVLGVSVCFLFGFYFFGVLNFVCMGLIKCRLIGGL